LDPLLAPGVIKMTTEKKIGLWSILNSSVMKVKTSQYFIHQNQQGIEPSFVARKY
jgi:hypothetical protein